MFFQLPGGGAGGGRPTTKDELGMSGLCGSTCGSLVGFANRSQTPHSSVCSCSACGRHAIPISIGLSVMHVGRTSITKPSELSGVCDRKASLAHEPLGHIAGGWVCPKAHVFPGCPRVPDERSPSLRGSGPPDVSAPTVTDIRFERIGFARQPSLEVGHLLSYPCFHFVWQAWLMAFCGSAHALPSHPHMTSPKARTACRRGARSCPSPSR